MFLLKSPLLSVVEQSELQSSLEKLGLPMTLSVVRANVKSFDMRMASDFQEYLWKVGCLEQ